ncbi:MAG: DeoR/GlpR transcriptional regulator [Solobacterium sp.]|nr:DeoR/GlpR transcriptional regulator [Solobacterium sp.]
MSKQKRWSRIIDLCRSQETVTVEQLVQELNASPATIRRDLQDMEDLRMLERFHGGARISGTSVNEPAMKLKSGLNAHEKRQIGYAAAKLIHDNQMVYIDAGSTTFEMLEYISARNITVVTSGVPHLAVLGRRGINTIVLGGKLHWQTEAITGKTAVRQMEELYFDISFVGTNGIHESIGFTTSNELEADTKSLAIRHSRFPYILADSTKFNQLSPVPFARLDEAVIVTDEIPDFDESRIRFRTLSGRTNIQE